jgi:thiol-disulfide isomerase/thioredoxin
LRRGAGMMAVLACAVAPGALSQGLNQVDAVGGRAPIRLAASPKSKPRLLARKDEPDDKEPSSDQQHPFPKRQRAPELDGGRQWINTAGPIELKLLKGKFVLLDFWTYCCINCMHILPELKKLEHAYPNEVVVIGVHSAKFETERDSKNIHEAIERYEIEHPVVNDADHVIWDKYQVRSWPTLAVIDPEGNLVAMNNGEIDFDTLDKFFKRAMPYYRAKGTLKPEPPVITGESAGHKTANTPLRYPGKVLADEKSDRLFIADSNHNRIVVTTLDGDLVATIGSGKVGAEDGSYEKASFNHPQGMALAGNLFYVADTENNLVRKVDLKAKEVSTIAGTGEQGRGWPGIEDLSAGVTDVTGKRRWVGGALKTALNSPWALVVHGHDLFIAMAGTHQIWKLSLGKSGEIGPYAGNGREDVVDGPLLPGRPYDEGFASFAQPSGLSSDGKRLFVADSEGSSIRAVPFDASKEAETVVGTAWMPAGRLFAFGDVDGQGQKVRLQHALDVLFHGGLVYVADTYNNKIKVVDPRQLTCKTLAGTAKPGKADNPASFDEPTGLGYARGKLYVADTNNHAIRTVDIKSGKTATLEIKGLEPPEKPSVAPASNFAGAAQVNLAIARVKPQDGKLLLKVALDLPSGFKINPLAPLRYLVEAPKSEGPLGREGFGTLVDVEAKSPSFEIEVPAKGATGSDQLKVSLSYYYCQSGGEGVCRAGSVVWNLPITLANDAPGSTIQLPYKVR